MLGRHGNSGVQAVGDWLRNDEGFAEDGEMSVCVGGWCFVVLVDRGRGEGGGWVRRLELGKQFVNSIH